MDKDRLKKKLTQLKRQMSRKARLQSETFDPEAQSWASGYEEAGDFAIEEIKKFLGL